MYSKKTIFDVRAKRSWREHSPLFARERERAFISSELSPARVQEAVNLVDQAPLFSTTGYLNP